MTRKLIAASFLAATSLAAANASAYTVEFKEPMVHPHHGEATEQRCNVAPHDHAVLSHGMYHQDHYGRPFRHT